MPDTHDKETSTRGARPSQLVEVNGLTCSAADINGVMNLIVSAYLLFDPNGKGYICRDAVSAMIEEGKGGNAMLSQQRWNEMVWASQCLSLPYLLVTCVGLGCQWRNRFS